VRLIPVVAMYWWAGSCVQSPTGTRVPRPDYSFSLFVLVDNLDEYFTSTLSTLIVLPTHPLRLLSAKDLFACRQVNASRLQREQSTIRLSVSIPQSQKPSSFFQKTTVFHSVRESLLASVLHSLLQSALIAQNEQVFYCIGTKDPHFPASYKVCLGKRSSFEHRRIFPIAFSVAILSKCNTTIYPYSLSQTIWPRRASRFQRCFPRWSQCPKEHPARAETG
jgi:hypothetical protein